MDYRVYVETLGCAKNQVDSEIMIGLLDQQRYLLTGDPEHAEVIVVNTCGFIESAKAESVDTILEMAQYKTTGRCKMLVVTGCLAQRYAEELRLEIPEIDALVGTGSFDTLIPVIDRVLKSQGTVVEMASIDKEFSEALPRIMLTPKHQAYLKIAEGCDNMCTYCIIPKLRGRYRSRVFEDILTEARALVADGVTELIIIAQDITRYGIDRYLRYRLADLLYALNEIEGLRWIRLQYCYPDIINDELIEAIASCEKVAHYIDMPVQHIDDNILKRMNRRTSGEAIRSLIEKLRARIPDIAIRTTMIVGFPGETEAEFEALADFVKWASFDKLGVFPYSQEEDTPAALLPQQLEDELKLERRDRIMEIQMGISSELMANKVGLTLEVLIEEAVEDEDVYIGRTQYDAPEIDGVVYVNVPTDAEVDLEIGTYVQVRIADAMEYDLIGDLIL
ncbi:30S ribosomal protein S12 methylthiotransferase RimO [Acidaminobacter hydrogenoformans]|uniref:Ribosomal protein uS12 methylthiotransferase RimO n=1 Tax=Acidaminobacter hydrogenoformans DSM 2784 TaxID=1120920 RepID=A0A1G5RRU1_9FIRM|nr:30S ribosomal protein S12 methylthiotransferase RimO [Acidaminobacter hydrogenoformans]SCZ76825.1 ribosomal protein S12 methylthiotransferase [Acidaminobacter hydrogenoformans DSM 2784]